jgi:hypothetical protein
MHRRAGAPISASIPCALRSGITTSRYIKYLAASPAARAGYLAVHSARCFCKPSSQVKSLPE